MVRMADTHRAFLHFSPGVIGSRDRSTVSAKRLVSTDETAHHVRVVIMQNRFVDLGSGQAFFGNQVLTVSAGTESLRRAGALTFSVWLRASFLLLQGILKGAKSKN